ncbi:MAG TPA: biotin/lipoyl-containing protein, partial [Gemmatimonadales bacterium]|nr:biotin/lipoyl-containing protein [Gemmatimonadales bacterium]
MSRIDVIMPQMGESIAEGTLSKWLKKVGDTVKRDEPIFEISTDKVDAEIPAPTAGTLAEILVQEGETVAIQTVVARIETAAGAATAAPASGAARVPPADTPEPTAPAAPAPAAAKPAAPPAPAAATPAPPADTPKPNGAESAEERLRRKSTPLVRKMAAEHNLDIATIPGTGMAGRVTRNDVVAFLESGAPAGGTRAAPDAAAPTAPASAPPTAAPQAPAAPAPAAAAIAHPAVEPWPG